jgi:hypothetical protein
MVDDQHLLALGRAVHAFQTLEWLAILTAALMTGDLDT